VTDAMLPELRRALSLHRAGMLADAARHYESVLEAKPLDFEGLFYFAQLREAQGRDFEALGLIRAAAAQRPDSAETRFHLGALLVKCRHWKEAIPHLCAVLELQPDRADAFNALGAALRHEGKLHEAALYLRRAVELSPDLADAHHNLGIVLRAQYRFDEAIAHLERAVALQPNAADSLSTLGHTLSQVDRYDEALANCRRALALDPGFAWAHANLAEVLVDLGRFDEARNEFERAVALSPSPRIYAAFTFLEPVEEGGQILTALEGFASQIDALSEEERIALDFALGKAYADIGRHERAFEHLLRGNARHRAHIRYDEAGTLRSVALTERLFTSEFVEARQNWGYPSDVPVFIVGMPRSGTTLIEQILASYPGVHPGGELSAFSSIATEVLTQALAGAIDEPSMRNATASDVREIGRRYAEHLESLSPGSLRVTDKLPNNAFYTGLIHLALPKARIIHAHRDPIDTCLSCFFWHFTGEQPFAYDLGELGRYYAAYEGLMRHWYRVLPEGTILNVHYEDVVADLEGQARRIVAYCGLDWNPGCLEFYKTERPVRTASATQVRKPIYTSSVGRWKPYAKHLGALFEALGMHPEI
jgi:tetratricopeptide (TPR) repeat protein